MRVRTEHWQLLLDECEENPQLITNKFNGVEGKAKGNALWQTLAQKLNSLGFGEKSVEGWRKTLIDWKCKTKAKAVNIKTEINKTGGGPKSYLCLSDLEERLLKIMGKKSVAGDEAVRELGLENIEVLSTQSSFKCVIPVKPSTSQRPEEIPSTSKTVLVDTLAMEHDYADNYAETSSRNSQVETQKVLKKKVKPVRRRPLQSLRLSTDLVELNQRTVNLLENLNDNTARIADALSIIADCAKKQF